jgi:hypothetical protein
MKVRISMVAVAVLVIALALTQGTCAAQGRMVDQDSTSSAGKVGPPALSSLGDVWQVTECCGWSGTWTRRPGTNTFDAKWRHTNGTTAQDVVTLQGFDLKTNRLIIKRQSINGTYTANVNTATRTISNGWASWYPAGETWSARY